MPFGEGETKPPCGIMVYAQSVDRGERPGDPARYDLFLRAVPGDAPPVRLTDFRHAKELGGTIDSVRIDRSGRYVAFCADRKDAKPDDEAFRTLWLLDLRTRQIASIALPGRLAFYQWSPTGSLLAAEAQREEKSICVWLDPATRRVHRWAHGNIGLWRWWGTGDRIVYEDEDRHLLYLRALRNNRIEGLWALSDEMAYEAIYPLPDGKAVLLGSKLDVLEARRGSPIKPSPDYRNLFRKLGMDEIFWSPNRQRIALHRIDYWPEGSELPRESSSAFSVRDAVTLKWERDVLTADNGPFVADPPEASLKGWSRDSRWLLITQTRRVQYVLFQRTEAITDLWVYDTQSPAKVKIGSLFNDVSCWDWRL
jgi:dipeptidyl aminopeptidase/acylaminoacyl peptidase